MESGSAGLRGERLKSHPQKILTSVLVKPAGPDCNMACDYCFYLEKVSLFQGTSTHRMSDSVLKEMIRQVMSQSGPLVSFGWQGGEPTLMGVDFFQKAVDFQKQYGRGQSVGNGLQTNGLLIDQPWADFLKAYRFLVGLSLDGPEAIHDRFRKTRGGGASWRQVTDTAKRLLDSGVEVNALTVVNSESVGHVQAIYEFHKSMGLNHMQFIPCVEADPRQRGMPAPFSVDGEDYGEFLAALFDLWTADFQQGEPTTFIRFFDSVFYAYVDLQPPVCTLQEECGDYLVVEHNGEVYACDFFVEPAWRLGHVMEDSLTDLLNSEKQRAFGARKKEWAAFCGDCAWLAYCRGGCPKDRMLSNDPKHQPLCRAYQIFFEHAHDRLTALANGWKKGQRRQALEDAGRLSGVSRNDPCPCGSGKKYKNCCGP